MNMVLIGARIMVKLVRFKVKNFKSISEIGIDIGNFNILVGKNNTGKSTILDAIEIFLKELKSDGDPLDDHVWPRGICDATPIEFTALFKVYRDDVREGVKRAERIHDLNTKGWMIVSVSRTMTPEKRWTSPQLSFTSSLTVELSNEQKERLRSQLLSRLQSLLTEPKRIDVIRGQIQSSTSRRGLRGTLIPDSTLAQIKKWKNSRKTADLTRFIELNKLLNQLTGQEWDLRQEGEHLCVFDEGYSIDICALGGGIQEMVYLAFQLIDSPDIIMIEEPEAHAHPEQTKRILNVLRKLSSEKTILVTTHSTIFADSTNFSEILHVTNESGYTSCLKIDDEDFPNIAYDLGIEPSDIFMTSKIVFVEGPCDKMVIESWASMLDSRLRKPDVKIVIMEGMGNAKREIRVWKKVVEPLNVSMVWVFDNDVNSRFIDDLVAAGAKPDSILILEKGTIEDYYPIQLVLEAMKDNWSVSSEKVPNLVELLTNNPRAESIFHILDEHGDPEPTNTDWKTPLARHIAKGNFKDTYNENELKEAMRILDHILAK